MKPTETYWILNTEAADTVYGLQNAEPKIKANYFASR